MNQDPSSKTVLIKRKITIGDYNKKDVEDLMKDSSRSIGAYWYGKKPATGLTYDEIKIVMPLILNSEITDRDFREKCENYFHEIDTRVPQSGAILEIGLMDNSKPLSETNVPLSPIEWVAYKHAKAFHLVAPSRIQAEGNALVKWYIEDPDAEIDHENKVIDIKDEALQLYLANKSNKGVIDMVLDLSHVKAIDSKKVAEFKKLSETKPDNFIRLINDKNIKLRYLLSQAISQSILKRVGTAIVWNESGESLGANMEEVLVNLKDKAKTPELNKIKASLKSYKED